MAREDVTPELHPGVSSEGAAVVEAEWDDADPAPLVAAARARGAELLWVHANTDLSRFGFAERPGYARLRAEAPAAGEALPELPAEELARLLDRAYRGLWGHKQVPADFAPPRGAVVLALHEQGEPVGLATVLPAERLVDGPGVVPERRAPERYARLLAGACRVLGDGPVDLDSWGDAPEVLDAYRRLGFEPVEQVRGWELRIE